MSLSNPKATFNILSAETIAQNQPQKVLLVGQMTTGSATSGVLVQDIQNDGSENALFGEHSMLAEMVRAFKRVNSISQLDAIPLADDGSAVAATGTIVFSGSPTATGTLLISIGSSLNHTYSIPVGLSDTPTTLGTALVAAITADPQALVTAVNTTGSVAITAINKGLVGNGIGIQLNGGATGVAITVTAMASGATNPSLTGLFNVVNGIRYQTVVYPSEYTLTTLTTNFLDQRFNVNNDVLDGVGIICKADTFSNLVTLGNTSNSQSLVIIGNQLIARNSFNGGAIFELSYVISSYFAAVRSLRFTDGTNISQYVVGGQSSDQFGGPALSSLPYFNTPFYSLPIILPSDEFTQTEIDQLGAAGVSVLGNNVTNNLIVAGQIYTAYKTDVGGNPDSTYQFLNYVDTISNIREFMFNNAKQDFRQSRLTEGDLVPNRKMHNQASISAVFVGYYQVLSGQDYVLVQAGEKSLQFYKQNLIISLNLSTGTVTIAMKTPIVTQLRVILATIQIAFSTNS